MTNAASVTNAADAGRPKPRCGAKTRTGMPCRAPVVPGRNRCRRHGGCSTGPKTPEGRARISEANQQRALHSPERSQNGD